MSTPPIPWLSMATAPKDGTVICAMQDDGSGFVAVRWGVFENPPPNWPAEGWFSIEWTDENCTYAGWIPVQQLPEWNTELSQNPHDYLPFEEGEEQ